MQPAGSATAASYRRHQVTTLICQLTHCAEFAQARAYLVDNVFLSDTLASAPQSLKLSWV
jgi:hypothetical protein